jgi:hypothetical protein
MNSENLKPHSTAQGMGASMMRKLASALHGLLKISKLKKYNKY